MSDLDFDMTRKRNQQRSNALDDLKYKIQNDGYFKDNQIVLTNTTGKKLSAILLEFVAPYDDPAFNDDAYGRLIAMAVIAWNAAILTGKEREQLLEACTGAIIGQSGEKWRKDTRNILAMMIKRKEQFFADDKRLALEYSLTGTKHKRHLAVATFVKSADSLSELLED